jgi:metal-responsive CopG/Arc/MetJ family transcriptional regulator
MREKTSVTLSPSTLAAIDRLAGKKYSRSAFIERVLQSYVRQRQRAQAHARDLTRLNDLSEELNAEAADVMEYQAGED